MSRNSRTADAKAAAQRAEDIAAVAREGGLRTGMASDGSVRGDGLAPGEVVYPLGVSGSGVDLPA